VENKKSRLENAASLENLEDTLDCENNDEFFTSKLDLYIWVFYLDYSVCLSYNDVKVQIW
jgi:hypothetical protein